jgi:hypothetical protein
MLISSVGSLSERSRLRRATGGTKVSVLFLSKSRAIERNIVFQYLLKSTPLHPHDLHDAVDECHYLSG